MSEEKEEKVCFKCEKCGKEKEESSGKFVLEGAAFCCHSCARDSHAV